MTNESAPGNVHFEESQRFRAIWLWALLILVAAISLGPIGYGLHRQLVVGEPWGDRPMSDGGLIGVAIAVALVDVLLFATMGLLELRIRVTDDAVEAGFRPMGLKRIPIADITSAEAQTYHPIRDFGGWGIRWGPKGKAYNVSGKEGVQIVYGDGERLMLGSQRHEELAAAIEARRSSAGSASPA